MDLEFEELKQMPGSENVPSRRNDNPFVGNASKLSAGNLYSKGDRFIPYRGTQGNQVS